MNIGPRELVAGELQLTSLPEVVTRVNQMVNSSRYSAADIAETLAYDTALAARLLKVVNSAFYGFPSQIDTISRAVTVIGTRGLRDLVLGSTVIRTFEDLPNDLVSQETFWRHSVYCALAARELSNQRRETETERFFLAGLLHDVGSLVIYHKLPELAREALNRNHFGGVEVTRAEQAVMGFDHGAVGGELLRQWRLPPYLVEAVEWHHVPEQAPHATLDASLVHIANIITHTAQAGTSGNLQPPAVEDQAWQRVGLSGDAFEAIVKTVEGQFDEVFQLFFGSPSPKAGPNG